MSDTDPPIRQLLPVPRDPADLVAAYAYPEPLERPWVRANMVVSADGAAWDTAGRSGALAGAADRRVLALLRGLSDVVLAGAGTARAERYRPVRSREAWEALRVGRPATPRLAVVTRSLDVEPELLATAPADARTLVVTTASSPPERRRAAARHAEVVVAGEDTVEPDALVAALAERGLLRVLCEGGPRLLAHLVAADRLDELCLTVGARLMGPGAARIVAGAAATTRSLRLEGVLEAEGDLFLRYGRGAPTGG